MAMVASSEPGQNSPKEEIDRRQEILCETFAKVLGLEQVGPDGDFFDLGGSSMQALRLEQELLARGVRIPALALLQTPTPAGLANRPDLLRKGEGLTIFPLRDHGDDFPFFFIHIAWGLCWSYLNVVEHIPGSHPLYGVQARRGDDGPGFPGSIREMAADYIANIRTVQENGPYHIAGWSFGGLAAHEIGVQLLAAGEQVAELILFDAFPSDPDRVAGNARWPVKFRYVPTLDEIIEDMYRESALIPVGLSQREIMALARIRQNNIKIGLVHEPSTFDGDLILVAAAESHPGKISVADPWKNYVSGTIHEAFVPCVHNDMFRPDMAGQTWAEVEKLRKPQSRRA
jgi:thioesterase domain-containing protein/aryl carrier-like protein